MASNKGLSEGIDTAMEEDSTNKPFSANPNITRAAIRGANVAKQRNVLGRGLQALMSSSAVPVDLRPRPQAATNTPKNGPQTQVDVPSEQAPLEGGLTYLSLDRIFPNASQPRQYFVESEIERLTESITKTGLLQPIVVRKRGGEAGAFSTYEIVAGERRYRAAKRAGLTKIPAILKQLSDRETLELGLIENVQRSDLNPIEEARAYQRLISDHGATQSEVAETVGKDRASVANALRLLKLPESVTEAIISGQISAGHGRALLMLSTESEQKQLCQRIIAEGLSVRAAEEIVSQGRIESAGDSAKKSKQKSQSEMQKSTVVLALEERLRRALGTKVSLDMSDKGQGEIRIQFYSKAELERILEVLS